MLSTERSYWSKKAGCAPREQWESGRLFSLSMRARQDSTVESWHATHAAAIECWCLLFAMQVGRTTTTMLQMWSGYHQDKSEGERETTTRARTFTQERVSAQRRTFCCCLRILRISVEPLCDVWNLQLDCVCRQETTSSSRRWSPIKLLSGSAAASSCSPYWLVRSLHNSVNTLNIYKTQRDSERNKN